jgi:cell division protein FtsZ
MGILTVAVVTKPFPFEGKKRSAIAEQGIQLLSESVDSLITIPNEKLLDVLGKDASLLEAFKAANDVLLGAVKGIADLIMHPGMINVDFADVKTVMSEMGMAMMGTGMARGDERAREAAESAIRSPLLEDVNLQGARGILVNITAGENLSLGEFSEVGDTIEEFASDDATVVVGTVIDPSLDAEMRVTVVATGLAGSHERPKKVVDNTNLDGTTDYRHLDTPAIMRKRQAGEKAPLMAQAISAEADMDYLDIPAFLRRQAD